MAEELPHCNRDRHLWVVPPTPPGLNENLSFAYGVHVTRRQRSRQSVLLYQLKSTLKIFFKLLGDGSEKAAAF